MAEVTDNSSEETVPSTMTENPEDVHEKTENPAVVPENTENPEVVPEMTGDSENVPEKTGKPENVPEEAEKPENVPEESEKPENVPEEVGKAESVPEEAGKAENVPEEAEKTEEAENVEDVPEKTASPEDVPERTEKAEDIPEEAEYSEDPEKTEDSEDIQEKADSLAITGKPPNKSGPPLFSVMTEKQIVQIKAQMHVMAAFKKCLSPQKMHLAFALDPFTAPEYTSTLPGAAFSVVQAEKLSSFTGKRGTPMTEELRKAIAAAKQRQRRARVKAAKLAALGITEDASVGASPSGDESDQAAAVPRSLSVGSTLKSVTLADEEPLSVLPTKARVRKAKSLSNGKTGEPGTRLRVLSPNSEYKQPAPGPHLIRSNLTTPSSGLIDVPMTELMIDSQNTAPKQSKFLEELLRRDKLFEETIADEDEKLKDMKFERMEQLRLEIDSHLQKRGVKLQQQRGSLETNELPVVPFKRSKFTAGKHSASVWKQTHLESNDQYYFLDHRVGEELVDPPSKLTGGLLRHHQRAGLGWLVSLHKFHLNGILADEMGLGKTVQVIAFLCHLMEKKDIAGPFLIVVPSPLLSTWTSDLQTWAPDVNSLVYQGTEEERQRTLRDGLVNDFEVLLTTYDLFVDARDRSQLSKIAWQYIIIDEGHLMKNVTSELNKNLMYYQSFHRLLLTDYPIQDNLEELWTLLNFLLPAIFGSSDSFSQWFNKPFASLPDDKSRETSLSEDENRLLVNRLQQVIRPFMLRRRKDKVDTELPDKVGGLVRCDASAYQRVLMSHVMSKLKALGTVKARAVENIVLELRSICNHPYLSSLHSKLVEDLVPNHFLPAFIRMCGKLEGLDRILSKIKLAGHRVLLFCTMSRLLDVMEEYLTSKNWSYVRMDERTGSSEEDSVISDFNKPDSKAFVFLLSIPAGVSSTHSLMADTLIIYDTEANPEVDLQAQVKDRWIGRKLNLLVLRMETVDTVEERMREAAEQKLGLANENVREGSLNHNRSAEDRLEYLEFLLQERKGDGGLPLIPDDKQLNQLLARSDAERELFEAADKRRYAEEQKQWEEMRGLEEDQQSRLLSEEDMAPIMEVFERVEGEARHDPSRRISGNQISLGKRSREVSEFEYRGSDDELEATCSVGARKGNGNAHSILGLASLRSQQPFQQLLKTKKVKVSDQEPKVTTPLSLVGQKVSGEPSSEKSIRLKQKIVKKPVLLSPNSTDADPVNPNSTPPNVVDASTLPKLVNPISLPQVIPPAPVFKSNPSSSSMVKLLENQSDKDE